MSHAEIVLNDEPDELYLTYDNNVEFILYPDTCSPQDPSTYRAKAIELSTLDSLSGCWYRYNDEVEIHMANGNKFYDYRFLARDFKPRWKD